MLDQEILLTISNLKMLVWHDQLPDGSYSVSDIQDYYQ